MDGNEWLQIADTGPSPRAGHSMTYDETRKKTVLFGGMNSGDISRDTWEMNDNTWKREQDIGPSHASHSCIVNSASGIILFGGYGEGMMISADTWQWNGLFWKQRQNMGPKARYYHAMTYNKQTERIVLFGGKNGDEFGDTWELKIELTA